MPRGGVLARFYRPGGGSFELFLPLGGRNLPIKKIAWGWSGLELTDALFLGSDTSVLRAHFITS